MNYSPLEPFDLDQYEHMPWWRMVLPFAALPLLALLLSLMPRPDLTFTHDWVCNYPASTHIPCLRLTTAPPENWAPGFIVQGNTPNQHFTVYIAPGKGERYE